MILKALNQAKDSTSKAISTTTVKISDSTVQIKDGVVNSCSNAIDTTVNYLAVRPLQAVEQRLQVAKLETNLAVDKAAKHFEVVALGALQISAILGLLAFVVASLPPGWVAFITIGVLLEIIEELQKAYNKAYIELDELQQF
ncbi:MAG: hypothetical protein ACRCXZ_08950 [Patescibacteria group bacterium]